MVPLGLLMIDKSPIGTELLIIGTRTGEFIVRKMSVSVEVRFV